MKTLFSALLILFVGLNIQAQSDYKAHNDGWMVDMNKAYEESKKTGKPIMANFTGSDWCGWCTRLTNDVFSKPEFKKWAKDNVILLELDFPRRKQLPDDIRAQNSSLQQTFQVTGYPTVWLFNVDKNPENNNFMINALGKTGYNKSVDAFISICDSYIQKGGKS
jgi:thioredoxin-related protein